MSALVPVDVRRTEDRAREAAFSGDYTVAATIALEAHGPELLGYLVAICRDRDEADDIFADVCERVWKALPSFRFEATLRTWMYTIARNCFASARRRPGRENGRVVGLSQAPEVQQVAEKIRTTTAIHLQTRSKDRLSRIRATLDADEQTLLILRIDRQMAWRDIAQIMGEPGSDHNRVAATLRKRFERLKERIRAELAADSG